MVCIEHSKDALILSFYFSDLHWQTAWCPHVQYFWLPCWLPRLSPITANLTLDPISPSTTLTLDPISPSTKRLFGHSRLTSARRTVVLGKTQRSDKIGETLKSTKRCFKNQRQAGKMSLHRCENFWTLCSTLGHKIKE